MTQLFSKSWSEFPPTRLEVKSWLLQRQWTLLHCELILCPVQQEAADALRVFPPTPPSATFNHCKWTGKLSGNKEALLTDSLCACLHSSWVSCMLRGYKCNFKTLHCNTAYLRILKILSALLHYSKVVSNVFCVCTKQIFCWCWEYFKESGESLQEYLEQVIVDFCIT